MGGADTARNPLKENEQCLQLDLEYYTIILSVKRSIRQKIWHSMSEG